MKYWMIGGHTVSAWNGMLTILIDPQRLGTGDAFASETTAFLASLRQSPVAPGNDRVRIAGEPEREMRAKRERDGIPVDATTWEEILKAGEKLKLPRESIDALAKGGVKRRGAAGEGVTV
jgi:hydroxycarboxylate dehydrogenase B